jgi:hypothetical protein
METYGEVRYSSTILDLYIICRCAVSFTPIPLYPRYSLVRRLGGTQSRSGGCGGEKDFSLLLGIET